MTRSKNTSKKLYIQNSIMNQASMDHASDRFFPFNCTFRNFGWSDTGSQYSCMDPTLGNLHVTTLTAIYGTHLSGKSNTNVGGLRIHNKTSLNFFPGRMDNFFPNLAVIDFYNNNITQLSGDELNPFIIKKVK
jgi:hypothetical protein